MACSHITLLAVACAIAVTGTLASNTCQGDTRQIEIEEDLHKVSLLSGVMMQKVIVDGIGNAPQVHENENRVKTKVESSNEESQLKSWQEALDEDPNMFNGCSNVFLDVGANRGTHVRKLFEAHKYPGCEYLTLFDEGFGPAHVRNQSSTTTGICAFGFEANPRWSSTLFNISKAYSAQGWRVKWFVPRAVSNTDQGNLTFWLNDNGTESDWGASTEKLHSWSKPLQVQTLDLSGFMMELNKSASPGYRLMKMDIEGAEYETLPPFLANELLCKNVLDDLTIEWHDHNGLSKDDIKEFNQTVSSPAKCHSGPSTKVLALDDEAYLFDGKPLP